MDRLTDVVTFFLRDLHIDDFVITAESFSLRADH